MKIRPAKRADVPAILDIYNDAVLTTTATYDYEPRPLQHRVQWFEDHEKSGFPIFVAEDDSGKIVGWSSLSRYHDRKGYQFTSENSIYIAAHARGRGIGKLLLEPLIESAKKIGLRAIIAVIDATNEASIRLHARCGFFEVGRFQKVGFKFGRWLDVVYMELLLPEPATPQNQSQSPAATGS
jgi:L-amino acid N-acyltransferase YncA